MDNVEYAKIDAASKPICFHKSFLPVKVTSINVIV
jgi:hypothetical protein